MNVKHNKFKRALSSISESPEMTLQEIADKLGISKQRVDQIEKSALKKLRNPKLKELWENIEYLINELNVNKSIDSTTRLDYINRDFVYINNNPSENTDFKQKY